MKKNARYFVLPAILLTMFILEQTGVLHISYIYIKSHELKWTDLSYTYFPKDGDIFTAGETVSQNNYEDALLAIQPNYDLLLEKDLQDIARNRPNIDSIDGINLGFYSQGYLVKADIEKKDISITDSTLFKKLVDIEIVGQYKLYDANGCELLYQREGQKFWIRNKIIINGRSRRQFVENKMNEITIAQMSNNAHQIIEFFERPLEFKFKLNALNGLQVLLGSTTINDEAMMKDRSINFLAALHRIKREGSFIYGHISDPDYLAINIR